MNIYEDIKKYFHISELVERVVFDRYGERAWRFFDPRLLENMLFIREKLGKAITVNNWKSGGSMSQRGLRTNVSPLVRKKTGLYLSAHLRGGALDFGVSGMTAIEVREWIKEHENEMPHPCRLERNLNGKPISWVHLDVDYEPKNPRVYLFDV